MPLKPISVLLALSLTCGGRASRRPDARTAILQEYWDKTLKTLESIKSLPIVWEMNGKYQPIPVQVNLQPPPGIPRPPMEITKPKT